MGPHQRKHGIKGVLVHNLIGALRKLNNNELREMFASFGPIELVDMESNMETGENSGIAVVVF